MDRRPAAAQQGVVVDVVVDEGSRVHHLNRRGHRHRLVEVVAAGGQIGQQRHVGPQMLAARREDVAAGVVQ